MSGIACGHTPDCGYEPDIFNDYLDHLTRSVDTEMDQEGDR